MEWMDHSLQMWQCTLQQGIGALQGVTNNLNSWAAGRGLTFFSSKTVEREIKNQ